MFLLTTQRRSISSTISRLLKREHALLLAGGRAAADTRLCLCRPLRALPDAALRTTKSKVAYCPRFRRSHHHLGISAVLSRGLTTYLEGCGRTLLSQILLQLSSIVLGPASLSSAPKVAAGSYLASGADVLNENNNDWPGESTKLLLPIIEHEAHVSHLVALLLGFKGS